MITCYGVFERVLYRNYYSGNTLFTIRSSCRELPRTEYGAVLCFGIITECMNGIPLKLTGNISEYHGKQEFLIESYELSSSSQSLVSSFLMNFDGVGEKTAAQIAKLCNNNIFCFVEESNAAKVLANNIPRLNIEKSIKFVNMIKNITFQKEIYEFITENGGSFHDANVLLSVFPRMTVDELKKDPYKIGSEINFPFLLCDNIAFNANMTTDNPKRLKMMVLQSILKDVSNGNAYSTLDILFKKINYLAKCSQFDYEPNKVEILIVLMNCKNVVIEDGLPARIYLKKIWMQEISSVHEFNRINQSSELLPFKEEYIKEAEKVCNIKYSKEQKKAFNILKSSGVKILCGKPGAGKTTFTNGLLTIYNIMFPEGKVIKLCAPTGRAARRLSESTGKAAGTIHFTLNIRPYEGQEDILSEIEQSCAGLFIIDEASMVDVMLLECILRAAKNGALVVFIGDKDQLSSVGPGDVLRDLIKSEMAETYKLNEIFRQDKDSNILLNARRINEGNIDIKSGDDFQIIRTEDEVSLTREVKRIVKKFYNVNRPFDTQVLSPTKKGRAGVAFVNSMLQKELKYSEKAIYFGKTEYHVKDKIMFLKNDMDKGICNGDMGIVANINQGRMEVLVNDKYIELTTVDLDAVSLAHAATIHKSQGSEYPVVIISLPLNPSNMLRRNLLYTAVTRAAKKVFIISETSALEKCIQTEDSSKRRTGLMEKLQKKDIKLIKS